MHEPDDIDTMTEEEVDALLWEFGYDPDVVWLDAMVRAWCWRRGAPRSNLVLGAGARRTRGTNG